MKPAKVRTQMIGTLQVAATRCGSQLTKAQAEEILDSMIEFGVLETSDAYGLNIRAIDPAKSAEIVETLETVLAVLR